MQAKVDELASFLGRAGATVAETMPALDHEAYLRDYLILLTAITSQAQSRDQREATAARLDTTQLTQSASAEGLTLDGPALFSLLNRRAATQAAWQAFFTEWDVLVCPTALDAAFPHETRPQSQRVLQVDDRAVPYQLNIVYPMWAIFPGQPATAFPAGLNRAALPLGLQAIGPYLEDRTTLRFAQLLEREWNGFVPPPAFA